MGNAARHVKMSTRSTARPLHVKTMAAGGGDLPEGLETTFTFDFATISMVSVAQETASMRPCRCSGLLAMRQMSSAYTKSVNQRCLICAPAAGAVVCRSWCRLSIKMLKRWH